MWLYLSTCLWGISLCLRLVQKKNRPEKFGFVVTPNLNILAVRWSVKYFLLRIPRYSGKCSRRTTTRSVITKCYVLQTNAKNDLNLSSKQQIDKD